MVLGLLSFAGVAEGRNAESLSLNVSFDYSGNIAVTLPDGTPVGVTSGSPTVIPAGFYTISLTQPGCVDIPYFNLNGPGVSIADNLSGGEVTSSTDDADFLPNSTYTWDNDNDRAIVYTFVTSSQVLGTPPPPASAVLKLASEGQSSAQNRLANTDIVGSGLAPFRGTLDATVQASGRLSLAFGGRSVTKLSPGRYTIRVADKSSTSGLVLKKTKGRLMSVTSGKYTGVRSVALDLTSGSWMFAAEPGNSSFSIVVG